MRKKYCYIYFLALLLLTSGCGSNQNKKSRLNSALDDDWLTLQTEVETQLGGQQFGIARDTINKLIKQAGKDIKRWYYIHSAIISLPEDIASPLISEISKISANKKQPDLAFGLSKVYMNYKQHEAAIEWVNRAIDMEPRSEFYFWRARVYALNNQNDVADADFRHLLKADPDNSDYQIQYANLLQQKGDYQAAQKILAQQDESFFNGYKRIIFALQANDQAMASKLYRQLRASTHDAGNVDEYFQLGEVAFWLDLPKESIQLLEQVNSGDAFFEARLLLARVLIDQKEYERAQVILKQIQSASAEYAISAYLIESSIYQNQNNIKQTYQVLNEGLMLFKDDPQLLYGRAMLAESEDDLDKMERDFKRIIELDPKNADAMNALGYSWANRNMRLQEAQSHIEKAYAIKPDNAAIIDSMAWVYYRLGDLKNAEKYIRMAIQKSSDDAEIYQHIIEILQVVDKQAEADKYTLEARKLFPDDDSFN